MAFQGISLDPNEFYETEDPFGRATLPLNLVVFNYFQAIPCFFLRATSKGFLLCRSSAGVKLRFLGACRRGAAVNPPYGNRDFLKENRCFWCWNVRWPRAQAGPLGLGPHRVIWFNGGRIVEHTTQDS